MELLGGHHQNYYEYLLRREMFESYKFYDMILLYETPHLQFHQSFVT